jgi:hypothetical protein
MTAATFIRTVGKRQEMFAKPHNGTARLAILALGAVMIVSLMHFPAAPQVAHAAPEDNVVLDWNAEVITTFFNPPGAAVPGVGVPPPVALLYISMVQGAIYDSVNMIDGGYQPYLAGLPAADASASKSAAAATAAHEVMIGILVEPPFSPISPAIVNRLDQALDDAIDAAIAEDGEDAVDAGIAAGQAAANAMLLAREDDGRFVPYALTSGSAAGEWRPTPPGFASDPFAWVGRVDPFLLNSTSQFRSKGPHDLKTGAYARDYNEVKLLGGPSDESPRTQEQEDVAQFYLTNPVEMFNRAFRGLAQERGLDIVEQARLFAMVNMAGADASINCVDDKIHWNFWRPITAIHNGDDDGNKKTIGDPTWTSMVPSPPYSEHASGYNCASGAFMHTAAQVFGNGTVNFSLVKIVPEGPDITRDYKRFADVVDDTIDARVYQGLHFRNADVQGAKIGKDVAGWLAKNYFKQAK